MPKQLFVIILILLVFPACAQMKSGPQPQTSASDTGHVKQHVTTGKDQKTIDAYKTDYAKNPHDQALAKKYVKCLEEIMMIADQAFEKEDFASAGKGYKVLLNNYTDFRAIGHMLSFNKTKLNKKLALCKDALSKKGFQEYRQGNLSQAIILWQGYLAIDPNNTDIKKAVSTAKLQEKNLQQTK